MSYAEADTGGYEDDGWDEEWPELPDSGRIDDRPWALREDELERWR
jgi:hypothetical protein